MKESELYLYVWQHKFVDPDTDQIDTRVCFGITGDLDNRQNGYEGHVGHTVRFAATWSGPNRVIRELENRIKTDFRDYLWHGHRGYEYEWLHGIDLERLIDYLEWEIESVGTVERTSG